MRKPDKAPITRQKLFQKEANKRDLKCLSLSEQYLFDSTSSVLC